MSESEPGAAGRELKLNSLSRYSKSSPRFVLEEYGSCEIPAGCGGVVLRWRDPREGVPLLMRFYSPGECWTCLDGVPPEWSRPLVPFGEHVLTFELSGVDPRYLALIFAAVYDEEQPGDVEFSRTTGVGVRVVTAADGTWKYSLTPPAEDWTLPTFDDSAWPAMLPNDTRPAPQDPRNDPDKWRIRAVEQMGAAPLGIAGGGPSVWVRKRFVVEPPAEGPREGTP